jgi:hypothetical protein
MCGQESCTEYRMGRGVFVKKFCRVCGVQFTNATVDMTDDEIKAKLGENPSWFYQFRKVIGVNLRVLDGIDPNCLRVSQLDGFNTIKPAYTNP